jgi:hypothetical protein
MNEPAKLKAAREHTHETYIITGASGDFHQAACDDCSWKSPEFDHRRHLAELAETEHQRAVANWPGTQPTPTASHAT